ncbi:P-loop containing nucleoside triphosphate hydrolase protein [Delitschia confertaspora ATCC 74209]|uniref:ATP-dependent RNA helicase ROK1 n=1 Tax=Delitschia confertaspora ATCC 74209 TaxID=1513339 RepID=A0A9P4JIT5_9PLEO|nr:P-loop containing nucleoside triphosphate hydrolase protein [Delitschia confertaspora ATCC 74209]
MDVFKLLSRSAKTSQNTPVPNLPSSGAKANPQLWGKSNTPASATEANKTRKRKRANGCPPSHELPKELDFFLGSAADGAKRRRDSPPQAQEKEPTRASSPKSTLNTEDLAEEYNEEECKRVLRSHKLKIVVLKGFSADEEGEKKAKKRKKEKQEEKKEKNKQVIFRPLTSFAQLRPRYAISRKLAENIQEQGYAVPTEVQLAALPLLLESENARNETLQHGEESTPAGSFENGRIGDMDLLTVAPTGSGKTIAFLIPIIQALVAESKSSTNPEGPRAIILAPTRELAFQIVNEARKLASHTGIKAAIMKKGMEVVERSQEAAPESGGEEEGRSEEDENHDSDGSQEDLNVAVTRPKASQRRKADIVKAGVLVATPLALLNAMKGPGGKVFDLPSVRFLALDEADVLLDPLFREQTLSIWNACSNPLLRVTLWSATMGANIEDLVITTLNNRWKMLSSASFPLVLRRPPLVRLIVGLKDTAVPNVHHKLIYAATEQGKLLGLRQLLHPTSAPSSGTTPTLHPPFLVFTQTIPRAVALHSELLYDIPPEAGGSSRIAVLHADLSATAREQIMTRFRCGEIWVLITTDLLARGVDFRGLNGVVNYDVPNSAAAYIHRVGRTGRAGREGGVAVTFYTQEDIPYIKNVANVIKASEKLRGMGEGEGEIKQWLLDALPTPTKRDRQTLKKRGVEARRTVKDEDGKGKMRISTKSGYERRMEHNRKGAVMGSRRRMEQGVSSTKRVEEDGGAKLAPTRITICFFLCETIRLTDEYIKQQNEFSDTEEKLWIAFGHFPVDRNMAFAVIKEFALKRWSIVLKRDRHKDPDDAFPALNDIL